MSAPLTGSVRLEAANPGKRARAWLYYVVVFAAAAVSIYPLSRLFPFTQDEAISLEGARRLLEGQLLGRDFFESVGPMEYYWQALFLRTFGVNIIVSRWVLVATLACIGVLIVHLARRIDGSPILALAIFLSGGVGIFAVTSYHWDADLFALAAFAFLLAWQGTEGLGLLILSALCAAMTATIMQQKGILLMGAFLVTVFLVRRSKLLLALKVFLGVGILWAVAVYGYYAWKGALPALLWADIWWPAKQYLSLNECPYGQAELAYLGAVYRDMINLGTGRLALPLALLADAPIFVIVAMPVLLALLAVGCGRAVWHPSLRPYWVVGGALWLSEFQRPDVPHLFWGGLIWLVLMTALIRRFRPTRRFLAPVLAAGCVLLGIVREVSAHSSQVRLNTRAGTLYASQGNRALEYIQAHAAPGEDVYLYPYDGMYNFLTKTSNPTRYTFLLHGMHTAEQFQEVANALEAKRVELVLWDTTYNDVFMRQLFPLYREPKPEDMILERYLQTHYHQVAVADQFRVLMRNAVN